MKVMTIVGTRPEIIRLSEVIKACDRYFEHTLVHTGQNWDYTLNGVFFKDLGLREPDRHLGAAGGNLGETIGNIISKSYDALSEVMPDALLILGDTNSALSAVCAKRLKIPVFHMEAGNRCFDQNVPEEINRKIVDHVSDINMAYTEHGRRYLLAEGLRKDFIFVTGSPMPEVLHNSMEGIRKSRALEELGLEKGGYFLVSAHREENIDIQENFLFLMESLNALAEAYGKPVVYSTHPRAKKKIEESGTKFNQLVRQVEPLGFFDYNNLQVNSRCVLSDSGTLSEEASILGFPGVLIRTSTERPEVLDKGGIVIGGIRKEGILQAVELSGSMREDGEEGALPPDYEDRNVSAKVVRIIQSYTEIVNLLVWRKR